MTRVLIVLSLLLAYITISKTVNARESTFTEDDLRDVQHPRFRRNPRLCGTVLLTALSSVCEANYASPNTKRTGSYPLHQRHNEVFDVSSQGAWSGEAASDEYQLLSSEIDPVTDHHRSLTKEPLERVDADSPHSSFLSSSLSSLLRPTKGHHGTGSGSSVTSSLSSSQPASTVLYRSVRSLTDECCKSPCSMSQLKAYCGGGEKKKRSESDTPYAGALLFMGGGSASPGQFEEYAE